MTAAPVDGCSDYRGQQPRSLARPPTRSPYPGLARIVQLSVPTGRALRETILISPGPSPVGGPAQLCKIPGEEAVLPIALNSLRPGGVGHVYDDKKDSFKN